MSAAIRARRGRRGRRGRHDARERGYTPDEASLRRIGWRLAALIVGLLCALLLVLGVTLYLTMQAALQTTMRQTLQARAAANASFAADRLMDAAYGRGRTGPPADTVANGAFGVVADRAARYVDAVDGDPFGLALPDHMAARQAMRTGHPLFSTAVQRGNVIYMLYTVPVHGPIGGPGGGGRPGGGPPGSPGPGGSIGAPSRPGGAPPTGGNPRAACAPARPCAALPARGAWGVIQVGLPEGPYTASLRLLVQMLLLVSALGLLAVGAISGVVVRRALRPIRVALRRQRDFVADAAHELRTPVTILRNAAELGLVSLADLDLPNALESDQQAAYEQTLIQSSHLGRLVDDLALLARADSGAVMLERSPVDLARLSIETAAGMDMLAEDRAARLDVQAPEDAPIAGDAGRLRQVLLILLDNALKHTSAGGVITVSVERHGGYARLRVCDTGPGIAPDDLPHVFDRFYRANRERRDEGSGLGLSIAHWIVAAHGGWMTAANAPERGAVFTVALPLAR